MEAHRKDAWEVLPQPLKQPASKKSQSVSGLRLTPYHSNVYEAHQGCMYPHGVEPMDH